MYKSKFTSEVYTKSKIIHIPMENKNGIYNIAYMELSTKCGKTHLCRLAHMYRYFTYIK